MKLTAMVLMAATSLLLTTGYAAAENAQQQDRVNTCNTIATQRGINGDARSEFMKVCLSAGGEAAAKPLSPQQEKMQTCNADAKAKGLEGADLEAFMKECLSGK